MRGGSDTAGRLLVRLLAQAGPVSGGQLAAELGVSRTAVWKAAAKLRDEGLPLLAQGGRGYSLAPPLARGYPLGPSLLDAGLGTTWLGRPARYLQTTDSTNRQAKIWAAAGAPHGAMVLADQQTAGRGRLGRVWLSPAGANLLFSLVLRPRLELRQFFRLTLAASVALAEALGQDLGVAARIKWPNDLFLDNRKLAGVLTEVAGQAQAIESAVVGVGLNVNDAPADTPAACLAQAIGRPVDRLRVLDRALARLEATLDGDLLSPGLLERWKSLSLTLGRQVTVRDGEQTLTGLARDIDAEGALLLDTPQGRRRIVCGDVAAD